MGFAFWKKKGGEPQAEEGQAQEPARAAEPAPAPAPSASRVRLRRTAIGAAVLLSAFVIAAPFFVSERAIEAETGAKTEIPAVPEASAQALAEAAAPAEAPAEKAAAPEAAPIPAAPSGAEPMKEPPIASAEDAAKAKAKADAEAKARAEAIAAENARAKAEAEKKAKEGRKAAEDQLADAIRSRSKQEADKKQKKAEPAKDQKKDAASGGAWTIPIGAFADAGTAKKIVSTARANGVAVSSAAVKDKAGKTLTRVTAGPFNSKAEASSAEAKLAMAGIKAGAPRQAK